MNVRRRIKVLVVTMGCHKNLVDSEVLMHHLDKGGYEIVPENSSSKGAVVIINTCGFIHDAKEESVNTILHYADLKRQGQIRNLYITGCLSQRYGKELAKEIPEADGLFGTNNLKEILAAMQVEFRKDLFGERMITTPSHYAYIKISEGCNRKCAFCAIPGIRGKYISKPLAQLVKEARFLAGKGVKEINLIAQDISWYGKDLYKVQKLSEAIDAITKIDEIKWVRLHYAYPAGFPVNVLSLMNENTKICRYLDIPLQHCTDKMLLQMRRGIDSKQTQKLIDLIREKVPDIAIRTTFLVGHPGETARDFDALKRFVIHNQFERVGVFTYSHEEDTFSWKHYRDQVPASKKQQRMEELMEIQQEISLAHNKAKIGTTCKVIIDRREGPYYFGRTEADSPEVDNEVQIDPEEKSIQTGDFCDVKIVDADFYDLKAVLPKRKSTP